MQRNHHWIFKHHELSLSRKVNRGFKYSERLKEIKLCNTALDTLTVVDETSRDRGSSAAAIILACEIRRGCKVTGDLYL